MTVQTEAPKDASLLAETATYWDASKEGRLVIKKCENCGEMHFYPRDICPHCFSPNTTWIDSPGRGEILSYSVMRRADPVYVVAYVTLEEGVSMLTNIVTDDFEALQIGMPVKVAFQERGDQIAPVFLPV